MRAFRPYQCEPAPVIRVLQDARDLVADFGWTRGKLFADGCYCLEGAVRVAGSGNEPAVQDAMRVLRAILHIPHDHIRALFDWNDAPGRLKEHVVQALDDAAERAEWIMAPPTVEVAA